MDTPVYGLGNGNWLVTGTIDAAQGSVSVEFAGYQSAAVLVAGTFSGTLVVEGSVDNGVTWGTCWVSIVNQSPVALGIPTPASSITAAGVYKVFQTSGFTHYRIRATAWTSGTATITWSVVNAPSSFIYTSGAIIQQVAADPYNSSEENLTSGSTYTGTAQTTLGVNAVQVNLKTDQNCTVYVDQSSDGDNWDVTDPFTYYTSLGGASWTIQATASYYRVRVKNNGASTTTYLRLQTCLCPIVEALPRSLDDEGYLKTGIKSIRGRMGRVRISPMGSMKAEPSIRLAGNSFIGGTIASPVALDTNAWATTIVGTGAVTQAAGAATLTTAATADSSIIVNSVRIARYVGGSPNYYRGNLRLPAVTTASAGHVNIRRWGAFDANDGYFFKATQTNPATTPTLSVVSRKETSDTEVTSFNGDYGTSFVLDNNVHTYEIWWSNKTAYFFVDDVLLHTITSLTTTAVGTPSLKVGLQTINSGGNDAVNTLVARSSMILRLGTLTTQPTSYYHASGTTAGVQVKVGAGNLHSIIFGSAANNAVITLADSTSAATPVLWVYTATGALAAPVSIDFKGMPFSNGLRFVVASGNASFTIVYE